MALTWFQRLQVAFRGWSRRREDESKRRQEEFLQRNTAWAPAKVAPTAPRSVSSGPNVDLDGLQAAFLDSSGAIAYYLDVLSGEVVERRGNEPELTDARYRRVPARTPQSDADDRAAFASTIEDAALRQSLLEARDAAAFRRAISGDRAAERAWYNFKNDRATTAIASWLRTLDAR
ncbi:MAG TPA: hypothetical protein VFM36_02800 [Thermoanaerobaculia bacterium]|nr:hypothetical protein [Thermoanaerobaculia bacterium]